MPKILAERPRAHAVIVGGDETSHGAEPPKGKSWKQIFLDEVADRLPMDRVHFTSKIPYNDFVCLLFDFFDSDVLAELVIAALADPKSYDAMKTAGRETILEKLRFKAGLPAEMVDLSISLRVRTQRS